MFRWMPATRRIRVRWFSPSFEALSQTSRAVSAASIDTSASRPRAATAAPERRRQSSNRVTARGGVRFRFQEAPTRLGEPCLEVPRPVPGSGDLLQTPLETLGQLDTVETLDFAQSSLKAEGAQDRLEPREFGFLRRKLGPPAGKPVAGLHELLDAA